MMMVFCRTLFAIQPLRLSNLFSFIQHPFKHSVLGAGIAITSVLLAACGSTEQATPATPAVTISKALGAYSASGVQSQKVLTNPQVKGMLIRLGWSNFETAPGVYDYTALDAFVASVKGEGKKWSLAVLAGPATPAWLYEAPYNAPRIQYLLRNQTQEMAPAWNSAVRVRLRLLAEALASHYGTDPNLEIVYVTQMTANGIEGQLPQDKQLLPANTTWADYGWTADVWVSAVTGIARDFANAFADKALAVELHDVLGDAKIPQRIGDNLCLDSTLGGRVGIAMWWLSGSTTYQPELLEYFSKSSCDKYGQAIAASDSTQFPAVGGYAAVFTQAKQLQLRYLEFWEEEFSTLCCNWETEIADFNTWSAATFPQ